jgi:hypothetical protein
MPLDGSGFGALELWNRFAPFGRITADFRPLKLFVVDCARFRPYFVQRE